MGKRSKEAAWVSTAIRGEQRNSPDQLWKAEPSAADAKNERFKRITFLRKHGKINPAARRLADRLDACSRKRRCISGACPECGRLFQRAWVRKSKRIISTMERNGNDLVAISLVPRKSSYIPAQLHTCNILNLHRRGRATLHFVGVNCALAGVDFALNEDREGCFDAFWCVHLYIIIGTKDARKLATKVTGITQTRVIPRPKRITQFTNTARRRSYAMKMHFARRIGYNDQRVGKNGEIRRFRNTSSDRLRAKELLELLLYLDQIGFAARAIFTGIKPIVSDRGEQVEFRITRRARTGGNR